MLPRDCHLILHVTTRLYNGTDPTPALPTKALHVQSRSYWAPANIGPYSQATAVPLHCPDASSTPVYLVHLAGQIGLVPHTMTFPSMSSSTSSSTSTHTPFHTQTVLALQHLFRIAHALSVHWLLGAIAILPRATSDPARARTLASTWALAHKRPPPRRVRVLDDEPDPWHRRFDAGWRDGGQLQGDDDDDGDDHGDGYTLPDWDMVEVELSTSTEVTARGSAGAGVPPCFTIEVEALPRGAAVEWCAMPGVTAGARIQVSASLVEI